jgi:hypothetical protein
MSARKRNKSKQIGPGRPRLYGRRILLPLADEVREAIDQVLGKGETRLDFIRAAIIVALKQRQ